MDVLIPPILYVVIAVNVILTLIIFSRGVHRLFDVLFGVTTFGVALWSSSIVGFRLQEEILLDIDWASVAHFSALFLAVSFFYFSLVFPNSIVKKWGNAFLYIPALLLLLVGYFLISSDLIIGSTNNFAYVLGSGYWVYGGILVAVFLAGFIELIRQYYRTKDKQTRKQVRVVFVGATLSSLAALVTDLILPGIGIFNYLWLGPVFTLFLVGGIFFAILKYGLFQIKVLVTELFSTLLLIALLIDVFLAESAIKLFVGIGVLIAVAIFSFLLVRSVVKEIEGRKKIESLAADLKKANGRLKELDQQKSEFVSIASHQLRSPLTAIKGYGSMLLEESFGKVPEKLKDPIEKIYHSSQLLVNLVEDLLNVTRIEQGRMQYEKTNINIAPMIENIIEEVEPNITHPDKVEVKLNVDKKQKYTVSADEAKIRQVFLNLIDNAIKYTPEGIINISLKKSDEDRVLFEVSDEGIGFSEGFRQKDMFGKFNRAGNGQKLHASGSGIGLYVAKEITEAHDGKIWAESEGEGKGATFYVELPAA